jgi:hypothetical protein
MRWPNLGYGQKSADVTGSAVHWPPNRDEATHYQNEYHSWN